MKYTRTVECKTVDMLKRLGADDSVLAHKGHQATSFAGRLTMFVMHTNTIKGFLGDLAIMSTTMLRC